MNELAAVTRRLIDAIMSQEGRLVPTVIAQAFDGKQGIEIARGKLRKRIAERNADVPIGSVQVRGRRACAGAAARRPGEAAARGPERCRNYPPRRSGQGSPA
jgi:hypothetical protein